MNTQTHAAVAETNTRLYLGSSVFKFLVSSDDTNGSLSIVEANALRGTEPPRHVHEREDETFMIKEGEMSFFIGENLIKAYPGDVVFAPRGVAHAFRIDTPSAKFINVMTPGHFDRFFMELSVPYSGDPITPAGPPEQATIDRLIQLAGVFGVRFV